MLVKMVFLPALKPEWMKLVRELDVEVYEASSEEDAEANIGDADAFHGRITPGLLAAGKSLRWIMATSAGLDGYYFPELRESSVTVTNMRGIYSDVIADHVFGFILTFARGLHVYLRRQLDRKWEQGVPWIHVAGSTLGVLGLGGIGLAVAERGHVFGMRILAVDPAPKETPDHVERVYDPSDLKKVLAESDFFVICVPHTGETEHMIDAEALSTMKDSAILVNIGRGKVVSLAALTDALKSGTLAGAALDVFEEEPLPTDHPLWGMENVLITPHVAAESDEIAGRRLKLILTNIERFSKGEKLLNVVDNKKGYVVEPSPQLLEGWKDQ